MYKSGFVNILGNPNVGKSSLLNALLGEKLCITSPKVQTTRHRIKAFYTTDEVQIIFSDTPGILNPKYKMHECMLEAINEAFEDADILVYLTSMEENPQHIVLPEQLATIHIPWMIVLNKIDLSTSQEQVTALMEQWKKILPNVDIIPVSATFNFNLDTLLQHIIELLPEHPPYFETDELSDRNIRFFISELIREKIFNYYQQEIPYSSEVVITDFLEEEDLVKIYATIYVARESQKMILIGERGKAIKNVGIKAREDIESFLSKKVYLDLRVKVLKNWRNDAKLLKKLGYIK